MSALEARCEDEAVYIRGLLEKLAHNSDTILLLQRQSVYTHLLWLVSNNGPKQPQPPIAKPCVDFHIECASSL